MGTQNQQLIGFPNIILFPLCVTDIITFACLSSMNFEVLHGQKQLFTRNL